MPEATEYAKKTPDKLWKRKEKADLSSYTFGKMPPQARDLEQVVLGAMMLEQKAVSDVIDVLKPDGFYVNSHQLIFEAMRSLFDKSQPIDILTVIEELRLLGTLDEVGGAVYISELTHRVASSANAEHHARIIAQKYIQRELIRISSQIIQDAYDETTDVFELLDKAEQNLFSVTDQNLRKNTEKVDSLITEATRQIESIIGREDMLTGVPSGFSELDRVTAGWQKSDLVVLAARPGMGKTAFVLSMARNAAVDYEKPVAIFSLEMSNIQLANRLIASETELPMEKLKRGTLEDYEWHQLTSKVDKLSESPLFIDDTPAINIFELRAKCRRLKAQHDVQLFIVDYLQLMTSHPDSKAGNREQEISTISRAMKSIAKELDTPVIAISQLSRAVETRGGSKRPQLSDLRESGAIEQDADMVIFLYRPEYYGFTDDENGNSLRSVCEVIIAKHRNGPLKTVTAKFIDKFAKFADMEDSYYKEVQGINPALPQDSNFVTYKSRMDDGSKGEDAPF